MKRGIELSARLPNGITLSVGIFAAIVALAASARCGFAADEFQDLVNKIPRSANAVVLLNMDKAKNSPLA